MKSIKIALFTLLITSMTAPVMADEDYKIDIKGQHAFIQFKVKHLGFSWILGEFNKFDGSFHYDEKNPEKISMKNLKRSFQLRD